MRVRGCKLACEVCRSYNVSSVPYYGNPLPAVGLQRLSDAAALSSRCKLSTRGRISFAYESFSSEYVQPISTICTFIGSCDVEKIVCMEFVVLLNF